MKKAILKRITALFLAISITVFLTACASFEELVTGFADTATYMEGETNLTQEVTLSVKLSENAQPVAFSKMLADLQNISDYSNTAELTELVSGTEIGLSVTSEIYEGNVYGSIGWVGPNGVEPIMTFIMIDKICYVGTEILGYLKEIDSIAESEETTALLDMIDCDYLKIDLETLPALLESLGIPDTGLDSITNSFNMEAAWASQKTMFEKFREYTPKILTEDYKDVLTKSGNEYTLTLNTESSKALLNEILIVMAEHETELKAFFLKLYGDMGLTGTDLEMMEEMMASVNFAELLGQYETYIANNEITDFDMVYKVAGTGKDDAKKQTTSMEFSMSSEELASEEFPFDTLIVKGSGVSTVRTSPIEAPSENVMSLEELIGKFALAMMPSAY